MDSILTRCDFVIFQVCDVVDRVLKSPNAEILKELHPVSFWDVCVTTFGVGQFLVAGGPT